MRDAEEIREYKEQGKFYRMSRKLILLVIILMAISPLICPEDPFQIIRATIGKILGMICAVILIPGGLVVLDWQWKGSVKERIDEGNLAMALVIGAYILAISYLASWI